VLTPVFNRRQLQIQLDKLKVYEFLRMDCNGPKGLNFVKVVAETEANRFAFKTLSLSI
jgi:hypothetical protein